MLKVFEWAIVLACVTLIVASIGVAFLSSPPPHNPINQQTTTQSENEQKPQEKSALSRFIRFLFPDGIAVFTLFLTLATIALWRVAIVQIGYLERAERISADSTKAAKDAADAAKNAVQLSAATAERQLRAYIGVEVVELRNWGEGANVEISYVSTNQGQTPARDVRFFSAVFPFAYPLPKNAGLPKIDESTVVSQTVSFPHVPVVPRDVAGLCHVCQVPDNRLHLCPRTNHIRSA